MAKLFRATPVLRGKAAVEFVKKMRAREKAPITEKDIKLAKELKKLKLYI